MCSRFKLSRRLAAYGRYTLLCQVLLCSLLASCSVLEDRSSCPCELYLDLSSPDNAVCDSLLVDVWSDGWSSQSYVRREDYKTPFLVKVPNRRWAEVSVVDAAMTGMYTCGGGQDGGTLIPVGDQCPRAYMYSSLCVTEQEQHIDTVVLSKNYCGVALSFVASDMDRYTIRVIGNVCGYSPEGIPLEGEFLYAPMADRPDICYFRLPRQLDQTLKLTMSSDLGGSKTFAIGSYIVQSGYDWTKRNLDDIAVCIDYAAARVTVTIDDWSTCVEYDVVI